MKVKEIFRNFREKIKFKKVKKFKKVSLFLGLLGAAIFILIDHYLVIFDPIKGFSLDTRFRLSSFEIFSSQISEGVTQYTKNPDAHEAIKIIGIDNGTINQYNGFPFSWRYYANLLMALEKSDYKSIVFDIFFLDDIKDTFVFPSGKKGKLSNYIKKQHDKVLVDYPFETKYADEFEEQLNLKRRLKYLDKIALPNVVPTEYDDYPEWVKSPELPIISITKNIKNIGFANIVKGDIGINRTMPMVAKWQNELYPSISLLIAAHYYGIDPQKDIEIKLGEYVKLKNIPQKKKKSYLKDKYGSIVIGEDEKPVIKELDIMKKVNLKREVTIPIDEYGFMDINFIGGTWSFPSIPFNTIANTERGYFQKDYDAFKDKILLVGMYHATGVAKDIHLSPFGDIAGVEHHANAVNTILNQDFLYRLPVWVDYLIYILIGLALGFTIPSYKLNKVLISILIFVILFTIEVFFVFNYLNVIHAFFIPYIELAFILVVIVGYRALTEEENVKYIRSTFSRYMSKSVVNQLLANPDMLNLGGQKKELTVFFSDIRDFTSMSERLTPEEVVKLLNHYFSLMTNVCLQYKGTVDKYMGDAIMAFWGAPVPEREHSYLACLTALEQQRQLQQLSAEWEAQGKPIFRIGIGINSGKAVVGNIGSSHKMEYTVMGDMINLGSRLESVTKVYAAKITISEYTYAHVKDKVIARELDLIRVKGRKASVRVYELMGIKNIHDFETYQVKEI